MKIYLVFLVAIIAACCTTKHSADKVDEKAVVKSIDYSMGPPTIIYKTKKDYNDKVFVILNDDKTKIVSYPAPQDVYYQGKLAYPITLANGYLLDNRGAGINMAFLNITYDAYSQLKQAPTLDDMMNMIIDKAPLTEMYNCGNRYQYKDVVNDLNTIIKDKQMSLFKKIK